MKKSDNDLQRQIMTPSEFIQELSQRKIYLYSDGHTLKFKAPEGAMGDDLRACLRHYKEDMMNGLKKYDNHLLLSPLSYNQKSLFFLNLIEPDNSAYNLALTLRLSLASQESLIKNALESLVQAHEQLRATYGFLEIQETIIPIQFIHDTMSPSFESVEAGDLTEEQLKKSIIGFYRQPFNLADGPMVKCRTYVRGKDESVLVIAFHHIAVDAWSLNIIMRDFDALLQGLDLTVIDAKKAEYREFANIQNQELQEDSGKGHLDFWIRMHTDPSPIIELGNTSKRPVVRRSIGSTNYFRIDENLRTKIENVAQTHGITTFALLLSIYQCYLFEKSGVRDITIGIPVMSRKGRRFENTVGYFINPIPFRSIRKEAFRFCDHAKQTSKDLRTALDHRDAPFAAVVEKLGGARDTAYTPVFQVMFNMLSRKTLGDVIDILYKTDSPRTVDIGGFTANAYPIDQQEGQFDMTLELIDQGNEILGLWKYCTDLFSSADADAMVSEFLSHLEMTLDDPERRFFENEVDAVSTEKGKKELPTTAISATFTAEVLQEFLEFWFEKLGWKRRVRFAPFNQIFQELLDPSSVIRSNTNGQSIVMVRLDDLLDGGLRSLNSTPNEADSKLSKLFEDLYQAVSTAAQSMSVPLFFVLCPSSPEGNDLLANMKGKMERFKDSIRSIPGVTVITHDDVIFQYPVSEYHEALGESLGRIPFTRTYLAALGVKIARSLHVFTQKPVKALAVDCDGTLWHGVAAEDGATGVTIGVPQRDFQQFLLDQYQAGVTLCLCSKNQEADVWAVFEKHPDMLLKRGHFTFWKINWEPKSENIKALADEINIGADAIAFIDDNPLERAEVSSNCPETICIEFPAAWEERTKWMKHLWIMDRGRVTAEDQKRQEHYRSEHQRETIKKTSGSLKDFLEQLELKIELNGAEPGDFERLGQLSVRTNQFNTTTQKFETREVAQYVETPGQSAHVARVSDRFGDYGLVGGMFARQDNDVLCVDGLYLSCRALGRGVEFKIASYLGEVAQKDGCAKVAFPVKPTERNEPARKFLDQIRGICNGSLDDQGMLMTSTDKIAGIRYETTQLSTGVGKKSGSKNKDGISPDSPARELQPYFSIAAELSSVDVILDRVEERTRREQSKRVVMMPDGPAVLPKTPTEESIAKVWKRVLGLEKVNTKAKFFEVGGTSLLMVRIAIELKKYHDLDVTIMDMFQYPTVSNLAAHLDKHELPPKVESNAVEIAARQREALASKNLAAAFKRLKTNRIGG